MKKRILIVEDETHMRMGLRDNLELEGYDIDIAENGKLGLEAILGNSYDLVILDVMLPEMSGLDVCKKARAEGVKTPIIMLTAKGETIDKVLGLELGADDYMTKPFSLRELIARVNAVLRRTGEAAEATVLDSRVGNVTVNFQTYEAFDQESNLIKMSHKEFEILQYLLKHKGEVVSRYDLLENVWGQNDSLTTRTVDNFIVKLRHKVEAAANQPKHILTVHGVGYKLVL